MKHLYIGVVAMMAVLLSTGWATAQYGPEEIGAEESPIPDPDAVSDDSQTELEEIRAMDGENAMPEAAAPEEGRKGRGCAVDSSGSTPSSAPGAALLLLAGLLGFRRLGASS